MTAVVAFHGSSARSDDLRPADAELTSVIVAPIAVDGVGQCGFSERQHGGDDKPATKMSNKHVCAMLPE